MGLKYKWQYYTGSTWKNSTLTGCKTASLKVPVTAARHGQKYRCVVTDANGVKIISHTVRLAVKATVTKSPSAATAAVGSTAKFTVKATGDGLKYQWQYYTGSKWVSSSLTGNKTATLKVPVTAARNGQKYRCVVTDQYGNKATSGSARLTVKTAITKQPHNIEAKKGDTALFKVSATGAGLKYQWQYYTGSSWVNSSLTGTKTATLKVPVTAARNGQRYRCRITDANGSKTYTVNVTLTVKTVITKQPHSIEAKKGDTALFKVSATGVGLKYQWQYYTGSKWVNSSLTGNKTATLKVPVTAARNGQKYRCVITDANGNKTYTVNVKLTVK